LGVFYREELGKRAGIDLTGYYKLYADRKRLRIETFEKCSILPAQLNLFLYLTGVQVQGRASLPNLDVQRPS
jgi:hypothetical protein